MASKGNPIIVTAAGTWVVTGDETLHIESCIWRGFTVGQTLTLATATAVTTPGQSLATITVLDSNAVSYNPLPSGITLSRLHVITLGGGQLVIWEK